MAIAGTGRVGMRERTGAAIGVIYAIILAVFAFMKFHEDWGTAPAQWKRGENGVSNGLTSLVSEDIPSVGLLGRE